MTFEHAGSVGVYDAKTRFSELPEQVEAGEEITISRHVTPVARLVPVSKSYTVDERREAIERIKKLSKSLSLGGLKIRDLIHEGQR